jgi:hypothetical protein
VGAIASTSYFDAASGETSVGGALSVGENLGKYFSHDPSMIPRREGL